MLQDTRGGGQAVVRTLGAEQDEVDVMWVDSILVEETAGGLLGHVAGSLIRGSEVAGVDPYLLRHLLHAPLRKLADQLLVGQHPLRQVVGYSSYVHVLYNYLSSFPIYHIHEHLMTLVVGDMDELVNLVNQLA